MRVPFDPDCLLRHDQFVRRMARALVADAHRADDVAQQAWAAAIENGPTGEVALRAWLARAVRFLGAKTLRGDLRRARREQIAARPELVPSTAELVEREAVRRNLVDAVLELSEPNRSTMILRYFEGLRPREIAKQLEIPVETVRTRIKRSLALLRNRLDAEHRDHRTGWFAALLPHVVSAASVLTMSAKAKLLTTAGAVLAILAVVYVAIGDQAWSLGIGDRDSGADLTAGRMQDQGGATEPPQESQREGTARTLVEDKHPEPSTGSLRVRVIGKSDKAPRTGVRVRVCLDGYLSFFGRREKHTNRDGVAVFEDLPPGRPLVLVLRFMNSLDRAEIKAGEEASVTFELPDGIDVQGLVVDASDRPVAGAEVLLGPWAQGVGWPVQRSGEDGRFTLRGISDVCHIGARAEGHAPSPMHQLRGAKGPVELKIRLAGPGGAIRGKVVDALGNAVVGAIVDVGERRRTMFPRPFKLSDGTWAQKPHVRTGHTDASGRFYFPGLATGKTPVVVRSPELAPWRGSAEIVSGQTAELEVRLAPPVTVTGTVYSASGSAAGGATVSVGKYGTLEYVETTTDAAGAFALRGVVAGTFTIEARTEDRAKVSAELTATAGVEVRWDARIGQTAEIRGRVLDELGEPIEGVRVDATPQERGRDWFGADRTDAKGRFVLRGCAPGSPVFLSVARRGYESYRKGDVRPGAAELLIRLPREKPRTIWVEGTVVDPSGKPVEGASVNLWRLTGRVGERGTTDASGRFRVGPLPPGDYRARVNVRGYPVVTRKRRGLEAGDLWSLGRIELVRPGHFRVRVRNGTGHEVSLELRSSKGEHIEWLRVEKGRVAPPPLAPGEYSIAVRGDRVAHRLQGFRVRPGEETDVTVTVEAGTPVEMRFVLPEGQPQMRHVQVVATNAVGARVLDTRVSFRRGRVAARTYAFAAGEYRLQVTAAGRVVKTASFTVGEKETSLEVLLR